MPYKCLKRNYSIICHCKPKLSGLIILESDCRNRRFKRTVQSSPRRHLDVHIRKEQSKGFDIRKSFEILNDREGSLLSYIANKNALPLPSGTDKIAFLNWIIVANTFENFLSKKFPDETLTNCEALVPAIKALILQANKFGVSTFVVGPMAHCGSFHVLGSCFHLPILPLLVNKLKSVGGQAHQIDTTETACKAVCLQQSDSGTHCMILGKSKAEQLNNWDCLGRQVWTIFLYSDCKMEGMRTAYEASQLSRNTKFSTKGAIHIILSDKDRRESKISKHLDLALIKNSPIIKVNALEPEAIEYCMRLAAIHRNTLQSDIFIVLEHPQLCDSIQIAIADTLNDLELKKPVMKQLTDSLMAEKLVTREEVDRTILRYEEWYEEQYSIAMESLSGFSSWISNKIRHPSKKSEAASEESKEMATIDETKYNWLLKKLSEHTRTVNIARDVARELSSRLYAAQMGEVSWKTAELIAFTYLLNSGVDVRLSVKCSNNSDSLSQRHYILFDIQNFSSQTPLDEMFSSQFHYIESLQAQSSVLGYEVGASQRTGRSLTIWEAGGPSLSNVQHVLDEFVSRTGQWFSKSNLLILVPQRENKYDKSCTHPNRSERVLDLCWEVKTDPVKTNLNVVNITTPANYFHLLLKQVHSSVPTVAFLPSDIDNIKSAKEEFIGEPGFVSYMADEDRDSVEEVVKVLICSGNLYDSVIRARNSRGLAKLIAIPRLEQLVPFPSTALAIDIANYRHASVNYLQEEHISKGWWTYVGPRLQRALKNIKFNINFIGPPTSIRSPKQLSGYKRNIINQALDIY